MDPQNRLQQTLTHLLEITSLVKAAVSYLCKVMTFLPMIFYFSDNFSQCTDYILRFEFIMGKEYFCRKGKLRLGVWVCFLSLMAASPLPGSSLISCKSRTMKKILILNGSPRKNGKTNSLVKAFTEDPENAGKEEEARKLGTHLA